MRSTFPPNQFGNVPSPSANFYGLPIDEAVPALLERALVFSTEGNPIPQCLPNEHQYLVAVSSATDLARKLIKSKSRLFPVRGPGISMHPSSNELGQDFLRALHPCINFLRSQGCRGSVCAWWLLRLVNRGAQCAGECSPRKQLRFHEEPRVSSIVCYIKNSKTNALEW